MSDSENVSASRAGRVLDALGFGLVLLYILEMVAGFALWFQYHATPTEAYASVQAMHRAGPIQGFHYWASALLIVTSFCLMAGSLWFGRFRGSTWVEYLSSVVLFLCSLGFQITGNLLPFDRHGVQTASIEAGIAGRMPVAGSLAQRAMLGGTEFGPATLRLWFAAHAYVLALPALAAMAALVILMRKDRERGIPLLTAAPAVLAVVAAFLVRSPLGSPAGVEDYGQFGAKVSWYTWPMHGLLHMFDSIRPGLGWIGAGVIPGLFALFLFSLPLWRSARAVGAARAVFGAFLVLFLVAAVGFAGSFAPLTGTRDPAAVTVANTQPKGAPIDAALAEKGRQAFNAGPCVDCHGKDGVHPESGPSLKDSWKRHSDPEYYMNYIRKPTSVAPDSTMPPFPDIPAERLRMIAEYLRSPK